MQVIGTAGHVDHGKSTLVERLTGIDPDRLAEEKRRGLTIDLGFAWLPLPSGNEIGIVDVPGHERFIKNMLAGVGGIGVCLFVVAANEGWKPQSAEHLAVVDLLGISHGVVALTKVDLVDEETLEIARAEVEEKLAASSIAGAPIVACSASSGVGIEDLIAALDHVVAAAPPSPDLGRPRLWVDRVFTIAGAGTVVTGTLVGGGLRGGQEVDVVGSAAVRRARIRSMQTHKKQVVKVAPGNRAALNLAGLERSGARRGDAVVDAGAARVVGVVDARMRVVDQAMTFDAVAHDLTEKAAYVLYAGTAETPVRLRVIGGGSIASGESGFTRLFLRDPLPLRRGDRFVLRDVGRMLMVAGGEVVDPLPRAGRGRRGSVELLTRLGGAPDTALNALLDAEGMVDEAEARLRTGVGGIPPEVTRVGRWLASEGELRALGQRFHDVLSEHHAQHPLERGMPREGLRAAVALDAGAFHDVVSTLPDVVEEGPLVRLASHRVRLDPQQERRRADLLQRVGRDRFQPPMTKELGAPPELLRALEESGDLVRIGDFHLTGAAAAEARTAVRAAIAERGPLTVAEIRDLLGTSRKYAVPLCEWLDATGATRRAGDRRVLGPHA